jgi:DNA-binding transcriptional regulator YiaG
MKPEQFKGGRLALGLTQDALGAFLDISTRQVRRYEKGKSEIPGPTKILMKILITGETPQFDP